MKYAIYIFFSMFLLACGGKKAEKKEVVQKSENVVTLTDEQLKIADITLGQVTQKSMPSIIKVNGQIDVPPQNLVSVSFPLGGYLKSTSLLPGMQVVKGAPIAVIEDQQFIQIQQDFLSAKARHSYLEREYYRQRELNQSKASSDKVFQLAETDYKTNQISVQALAEKLRLIGINPDHLADVNISRAVNIASPISGFVSKVNVNIGKYVNPTDPLFEIINPSDIHLRLSVFEKDVTRLSIGQKVIAYTANDSIRKYECEIILISKDVSKDRSIDVHCHFKQFDKYLVPGMYMIAEIETLNNQAMVVPDDAVVRYGDHSYIFITLNSHQFEMAPVGIGASQHGETEVIPAQGLKLAEKRIVTRNAYTLLMKLKNESQED